jgi:NUMOD4 motif-containing protein/HNH endonuclease
MEEEWRWAPGREGRYQVSSFGRVRSFLFSQSGRIMRLDIASNGYVRVHFQFKQTWLLHRLVATVFLPNPQSLPVVNHIDGNPRNNTLSNLEWVTYSDNMRHSWRKLQTYKNRVAVSPRGEAQHAAKLTEQKVREIRQRYAAKEMGAHRLGKIYGVSKRAVFAVIKRQTWAHVLDDTIEQVAH